MGTLITVLKGLQGLFFARSHVQDTIAYQLQKQARRRPDAPCLRFEERRASYAEANRLVNRHAEAYRGLGIGRGEVVALFMENRPEYIWHVLGLAKLGAVAGLIPSAAKGEPLEHAIATCDPKLLVAGVELRATIEACHLEVPLYLEPEGAGAGAGVELGERDFRRLSAAASEENPAEAETIRLDDVACHIFTSGTTGLPKAAIVRHRRLYQVGRIFGCLALRLDPSDVLYDCLPLHHTAGLLMGVGSVVTTGATLALARKFSARNFWRDCRAHEVSAFVYVGELCRYLLSQPPCAEDREHQVTRIVGNGLRRDVWIEFQRRFGVPRIVEFYASTEGNVAAMNLTNTPGAVGRLRSGAALVHWDTSTQQFVRGPDGFLVRCKKGETGIMLGKIGSSLKFDGYTDPRATNQRIIRDAFSKGDSWFNTGDLLHLDGRGNLSFVDRVGDSFRFKGHNVSTLEVEKQLSSSALIADVNVYGVAVEGVEGRIGMAALVPAGEELDLVGLAAHIDESLPSHARPVFVRALRAMDTTETLKLRKVTLAREGFEPNPAGEPVFFRDLDSGAFVELDAARRDDIRAGRVRL